jgi:hypothetical protein
MTTIQTRQLKKEDFAGLMDADPKTEDLLLVLNTLMKSLEMILNGGVGSDNLNRQIIELDIPKSPEWPMKFASKVRGRAIGVRLLRVIKTTTKKTGEPTGAAIGLDWSSDGSTIFVDGLPGTDSAQSYRATFEVVGP